MPLPEPGTLFLYRGPKQGLFRRHKLPAMVVGNESASETVLVRTLWELPARDLLLVEIGFIPIALAAYHRSVVEILGAKEVGTDWWPALQEWKSARSQKLSGSFTVPIHEVRALAWQVVLENQPDATCESVYLEYAFPVASSEGQPLSSIRVSALPRSFEK